MGMILFRPYITGFPEKHVRAFFWFFAILIAQHLNAQGPQKLVTVPVGSGISVKGWLYLPADYNNTSKSYPVVLFYHGAGEAGTDPFWLFNAGIPNLILNGMRPDNIINPADG